MLMNLYRFKIEQSLVQSKEVTPDCTVVSIVFPLWNMQKGEGQ
jgi:hypothetical protein